MVRSAVGQTAVAGAEAQLHEHAVDPAPELETHRLQGAGVAEAEFLMQGDGGAVAGIAVLTSASFAPYAAAFGLLSCLGCAFVLRRQFARLALTRSTRR